MSRKLTEWYPIAVNPARIGWYEYRVPGFTPNILYWDGDNWLVVCTTYRYKFEPSKQSQWRGQTMDGYLDCIRDGLWPDKLREQPKTLHQAAPKITMFEEMKDHERDLGTGKADAARELIEKYGGKVLDCEIGKTAADEMHGFVALASELPTIKEVDESLRSYIDREYKTDPITRARAEEIVSRFEQESLMSKLVFVTAVARDTQRVATFASLEKFHTMLKDLCRVILWLSTKELPDLDADAEQLLKKKRYIEQAKEALEKLNGTR